MRNIMLIGGIYHPFEEAAPAPAMPMASPRWCTNQSDKVVFMTMEQAAALVSRTLTSISAGGGLPTPYREDESPVDLAA